MRRPKKKKKNPSSPLPHLPFLPSFLTPPSLCISPPPPSFPPRLLSEQEKRGGGSVGATLTTLNLFYHLNKYHSLRLNRITKKKKKIERKKERKKKSQAHTDLLKAITAQWNPSSSREAAVSATTPFNRRRLISCPGGEEVTHIETPHTHTHTPGSNCIKSILSYANDSVTELKGASIDIYIIIICIF